MMNNSKYQTGGSIIKREQIVTVVFSLLLAFNLTFVKEFYSVRSIASIFSSRDLLIRSSLVFVLLSTALYVLIETALYGVQHFLSGRKTDLAKTKEMHPGRPVHLTHRQYLLLWGLILLFWTPALLAYYPGIMSYDSAFQTHIALGLSKNSRFHPPLHTFIWDLCIRLGEAFHSNGVIFYSCFQMLVMSAIMAYLISFITKESNFFLPGAVSFLHLVCNPVVAIMSMAMTKDVLFGGFLLLLAVILYFMQKDPEKFFHKGTGPLALVTVCVLCCLLRNNMSYALALCFFCFFILMKNYRRKILVLFLSVFLCYSVINGPVYTYLGIEKGNPREALSIPIQQIARVVTIHGDELTESEKSEIGQFLPVEYLAYLYNPRLSDPVKNTFNSEYFSQNKVRFIQTWLSVLARYPADCIDAFLDLNIPYWYVGASTLDPFSEREYIESVIYELEYYPVKRESKLPGLLPFYESFASFSIFQNGLRCIAPLFSISFPIWILLATICLLLRLKCCEYIGSLLPFLFLWATYLAGPVSNFRYVFPLYAAYPYFFFLVYLAFKKRFW